MCSDLSTSRRLQNEDYRPSSVASSPSATPTAACKRPEHVIMETPSSARMAATRSARAPSRWKRVSNPTGASQCQHLKTLASRGGGLSAITHQSPRQSSVGVVERSKGVEFVSELDELHVADGIFRPQEIGDVFFRHVERPSRSASGPHHLRVAVPAPTHVMRRAPAPRLYGPVASVNRADVGRRRIIGHRALASLAQRSRSCAWPLGVLRPRDVGRWAGSVERHTGSRAQRRQRAHRCSRARRSLPGLGVCASPIRSDHRRRRAEEGYRPSRTLSAKSRRSASVRCVAQNRIRPRAFSIE